MEFAEHFKKGSFILFKEYSALLSDLFMEVFLAIFFDES